MESRGRTGELAGPFIGRSVLDNRAGDLQRERTELENALGRFDASVPDDVIARMRTKLETIRAQLREMGLGEVGQ